VANINLLIVEDEQKQLDAYNDAIDEYNQDNEIAIAFVSRKNANDCIDLLKSSEFDAAIVDLNLEDDATDGVSGNDVLNEIRNSHRFPIFVVTGTPHLLDENIKKVSF